MRRCTLWIAPGLGAPRSPFVPMASAALSLLIACTGATPPKDTASPPDSDARADSDVRADSDARADSGADSATDSATVSATDSATDTGSGGGAETASPVDADADGYTVDLDCDDSDAAISPEATELCDEVDNDCDGSADESDAADAVTCYTDADADAYGDAVDSAACACGSGTSAEGGDCDDSDASVHPGAGEDSTDGVDNDCDGATDESSICPDWFGVTTSSSWTYDYADPGYAYFSSYDFTGERDVTASVDSATGELSLSFTTNAYGDYYWMGYELGNTMRYEAATATYTCGADGVSLVTYELYFAEREYVSYSDVTGEQRCTFDPPVLILPTDLEEGATWTTSSVAVECYIYRSSPSVDVTETDTLDFPFAAAATLSTGTWGDALRVTGSSFTMGGNDLELDFMADGAWVRGVGRVQDDKLDLISYLGE